MAVTPAQRERTAVSEQRLQPAHGGTAAQVTRERAEAASEEEEEEEEGGKEEEREGERETDEDSRKV